MKDETLRTMLQDAELRTRLADSECGPRCGKRIRGALRDPALARHLNDENLKRRCAEQAQR